MAEQEREFFLGLSTVNGGQWTSSAFQETLDAAKGNVIISRTVADTRGKLVDFIRPSEMPEPSRDSVDFMNFMANLRRQLINLISNADEVCDDILYQLGITTDPDEEPLERVRIAEMND